MRTATLMTLLFIGLFAIAALFAGCATRKVVMQGCGQINDSDFWICKEQKEIK